MGSARLYKTEAIVLRQRRLGEADRFLTLFTPTYGKLDVKVRGVRKTLSRMSGHLQPLTRCMLQMAQGHVSDIVTGCETLESFQPLRDDLDRLSRALYAAELIDRMTVERAPGFGTYRLLVDTLRRLQGDENVDLALRCFEMKIMDQSGFRPELECCVACRLALREEQNFFAPQSGGTVCSTCVAGLAGTRTLSVNALKVLRLLQGGSYNEIGRLKMVVPLAEEVERHLRSYIVCVLERDVNSAAFIERLRRDDLREKVEV